MHKSYEELLGHNADFRVHYKFLIPKEGGRQRLPYQGIRFDFSYEDNDYSSRYMIWPEFEDESGQVILSKDEPVLAEGTARMWILIPERRLIHREKITVGTRGFMLEGPPIAICEVIEVVGLYDNPTE